MKYVITKYLSTNQLICVLQKPLLLMMRAATHEVHQKPGTLNQDAEQFTLLKKINTDRGTIL